MGVIGRPWVKHTHAQRVDDGILLSPSPSGEGRDGPPTSTRCQQVHAPGLSGPPHSKLARDLVDTWADRSRPSAGSPTARCGGWWSKRRRTPRASFWVCRRRTDRGQELIRAKAALRDTWTTLLSYLARRRASASDRAPATGGRGSSRSTTSTATPRSAAALRARTPAASRRSSPPRELSCRGRRRSATSRSR